MMEIKASGFHTIFNRVLRFLEEPRGLGDATVRVIVVCLFYLLSSTLKKSTLLLKSLNAIGIDQIFLYVFGHTHHFSKMLLFWGNTVCVIVLDNQTGLRI